MLTIGALSLATLSCEGAGPGSTAQSSPRFSAMLTEAWASGGLDELGGVVFESQGTSVWGIFGPDGLVMIGDPGGPHVFVLDSDGNVLMRLGRRGQGPGEFELPGDGGFLGDSLLWITDSRLQRFTWFDREGRLISVHRQEAERVPGTPFTARPTRILRGGHVLGITVEGPRWDEVPRPLVFWTPGTEEMRVADQVLSTAPLSRSVTTGGGVVSVPPLFDGTPIQGIASGGVWVFYLHRGPETADAKEIPIVRYSPEGSILDTIRIPYDPEPVPPMVRDRARVRAEAIANQGPFAARTEDILSATWIPDHFPPVRSALADSAGFWLQTDREFPYIWWKRYDLEGRLVAVVELPHGGQVLSAAPSSFLVRTVDSLGVAVVRRFDVTLTPLDGLGR